MNIIFSSAGVVTTLFYIGIILCKKKHTSRYLLLAFLATLSIPLLPGLLHVVQTKPFAFLNVGISLLWGPLLYLYITSLLKEKVKRSTILIHIVPSLLIYLISTFKYREFLPMPPNDYMLNFIPKHSLRNLLFSVVQNCSLLVYSILTLSKLNKHNQSIKKYYSYTDVYLSIRWSYVIVLFFISTYTFVATALIVYPQGQAMGLSDIHNILITIFIYFLGHLGIQQKPVYINIDRQTAHVKENINPQEKYVKNKLSAETKDQYKDQLIRYLETEKPYLQPKLSIDDLSLALKIPKHALSQTINDSLNHSFYSLINSYRVGEVKRRIAQDTEEKYTLLSIAFDAGFNSKSGFNKNFKQETGITPLQYRKSLTSIKTE